MQLCQVSRSSLEDHHYARAFQASSKKHGKESTTLVDATKSLLSNINEISASQDTPVLDNALLHNKKTSHELVDDAEEAHRIRLEVNVKQSWTGLDISNYGVMNLSPKLFNFNFLSRLYINGNKLQELPSSISQLKFLRILDASNNLLTSLPEDLGLLFNLKYLYVFDNNLSTIPFEFGNLFELDFLGIEGNPSMDQDLVSLVAKKGARGLTIFLRDNCPKPPAPKPRQWITLNEDGEPVEQELQEDNSRFTLMTYNTLCQHYATAKMYRYTPSWALDWDYRRELLKQQVIEYSADVVCLQEVETRTFEEFWTPVMASHGYKGVFHCKSRARTMSEKNAKKVDGCAIFYKKAKFTLVSLRVLEYGRHVMGLDKYKKTEDLFNRFMNKDNIASLVVLHHIATDQNVAVAATHLHWDPAFNDVKAVQVGVLLEELQGVLKKTFPDYTKAPLIICGDFNSQTNSAVYELLSQGSVSSHEDIEGRDYGKFTSDGFTHPFHLKSSYEAIGELPFTNLSPSFTDVIDYIWYSTPALNVRGLLGKVDPEAIQKVIGFPNVYFPSDHIPLISEFEFKKVKRSEHVKVDFRSGNSRKT